MRNADSLLALPDSVRRSARFIDAGRADERPPWQERTATSPPRTLVVVPTYNEAGNILVLAERLRAAVPAAELLVVDDGSPDGTGAIVRRLAARRSGIHLLSRTAKQGLGAAYRAGFLWALEHGYDRVVQMDADLSHDPADVPVLLKATATCGVAIGSRYIRGGGIRGWPYRRWLLSRWANLYAQFLLGLPVRDLTGGFKAWRSETLAAVGVGSLSPSGYVFQVETTWRASRAGAVVREVPIIFRERACGVSKMGPGIAVEGLGRVIALAAAGLFGGQPGARASRPSAAPAGTTAAGAFPVPSLQFLSRPSTEPSLWPAAITAK